MTQLRQRISSLCSTLFHRGMKPYWWQYVTVLLNYFTTYQYETCSIWVLLLDPIGRTVINVSSEQTFRICRTHTQEDAVCREYDSRKREKTQSRCSQRKAHVVEVKCSQDQCTHGQKCLNMIKILTVLAQKAMRLRQETNKLEKQKSKDWHCT